MTNEVPTDGLTEDQQEFIAGLWAWEVGLGIEGHMPSDPLPQSVGQRVLRLQQIAGRHRPLIVPYAEAGSQIAADDDREWARRHGDLTVNHQAGVRLQAAVNHLAAHAYGYLFKGGVPEFYPHAEFSVLRGALEATSIARWLLAPQDTKGRVLRALAVKDKEARYEAQAIDKQVGPEPGEKLLAQLGEWLPAAREEAGLTDGEKAPSLPQSNVMVDACPPLPPSHGSVAFQWRKCSSYAHGYDWAAWHDRGGLAEAGVPYTALAEAFVAACDAMHLVWTELWLPLALESVPAPAPGSFLPLWPVYSDGWSPESTKG